MKTLRIAEGLVKKCLAVWNWTMDSCYPSCRSSRILGIAISAVFTSFIDAHQDAGCPIFLSPSPDPSSSVSSVERSSITPQRGRERPRYLNQTYTFGPANCLSITLIGILPTGPTGFHLHRSRDILVEYLATSNIP